MKVLERFGWWRRQMEFRFGDLYGGGGDACKVPTVSIRIHIFFFFLGDDET